MKKIKCLGILPELNENHENFVSSEKAKSPDEFLCWGSGTLKYDIPTEVSYSQSFQDLFVVSTMNGKRGGTYLELGCSYPVEINNTYLLETDFDWTGVSVDIDPERTKVFAESRKNDVFTEDAGNIDYDNLLSQYENNHVDYLQIDVDSEEATSKILETIDFNKYDFSVITFEHDLYWRGDALKNVMKKIMSDNNYILVAENVCSMNHQDPYEDWYINPKYVQEEHWKKYESKNKRAVELFFEI